MVSLPPDVNTKLFYDGVWNDISGDLRLTQALEITRGVSSEGSTPDPVEASALLNNRHLEYSPRNPTSPLFGKIGRNTPIQFDLEEGGPYLLFPSGIHSVSTPDAASLDVLGDIDVRFDVQPNDWGSPQMLVIRWASGGNLHYSFAIGQNREIWFWWSPTGLSAATVSAKTTVPVPFYDDQRVTIRVTVDVNNGASGNTTTFYYADALEPEEWIPIGAPVVNSGTTSLFNATAPLFIGDNQVSLLPDGSSGISRLQGKAYGLQVRDGIDGTLEVDLDVATNAVAGGTTFTGNDGRVWTRSGTSSLSNVYTRFVGEVPAWPPLRHLTGNDKTTAINPTGITRRLDAGNKPVDSAILRFIKDMGPIECWPLTDGQNSEAGKSLLGGRDMIMTIEPGTTDKAGIWAAGSLAEWIEPVIQIPPDATGQLSGQVPALAQDETWSVDFFLRGGGNESAGVFNIYGRGAGTATNPRVWIQMVFNGNLDTLSTIWTYEENDTSSSGLVFSPNPTANIYDDALHHVRFTANPGISSTVCDLYIDGVLTATGSFAFVMEPVKTLYLGWGFLTLTNENMTDRSFGYITYWDSSAPSAAAVWDAVTGHQGERAGTRIERLATEANVVAAVQGDVSTQVQMGIQQRQKFVDLVQACATSDLGYALEKRDANALWYRSHVTLYNQTPVFTLDFSNGVVGAPFKPVDDDKLSRNDVSVQRESGGVPSRQVLEEGVMSVQDPPLGIGRYDVAYERNLYTDDLAAQLAYQYLHLGTFDGLRYTKITLDLANPRVYAMIHKIFRADVGDKIRITNLPEDLPPDDVDLLILGYTEEIGADVWRITFNCIPGEPWNVGITNDDERGRADSDNSTLALSASSAATSIKVITDPDKARWVNANPILNSNSTFDSGISGWNAFGGATIAWNSVLGHQGAGSIEVTTTGAASPRAEGARVSVAGDRQYVLSGWLHTDMVLGATASVSVNWYTALSGGSYISTSSINLATMPTGEWTYFEGVVTAPATALGAGVLTSLGGTPAAGLVWRGDELQLRDYVAASYPSDFPFDIKASGERMTVTAIAQGVEDNFTRTVTAGWGTANSGQAWSTSGGSSTDYTVGSGVGNHIMTTTNVSRRTFLDAGYADSDLYCTITVPATSTGGSQFAGVMSRYTSGADVYYVRLEFTTANAVNYTIRKRTGDVDTQLASYTTAHTHTAGDSYKIRFQTVGSTLRAKFWLNAAGNSEPHVWQMTATDTDQPSATSVGMRSIVSTGNTNTNPTIRYDDFLNIRPQNFTVTRSVNGVVKALPAGDSVSLALPVYVAL